jgi:hypothetical protein
MNVALKINKENLMEVMEPTSESLTLALLEKRSRNESKGPQKIAGKFLGSLLVMGTVTLTLCLWGNLPMG